MRGRFYPELYPDELIYSSVARYRRHVGNLPIEATSEALLGKPSFRVHVEMPSRLSVLSERMGGRYTPLELAEKHTSISYYTAFKTESDRKIALERMIGEGITAPLTAASIDAADRRKANFHYCVMCEQEMLEKHGETYWRRDQQLPTVLTCVIHRRFLCDSGISRETRTQKLSLPDEKTGAPNPICRNADLLPVAFRLSTASVALLEWREPQDDRLGDRDQLMRLIRSKGYVLANQMADTTRMAEDLAPYFDKLRPIWPSLCYQLDRKGSWIFQMAQSSAHRRHPIYHLLIRDALDVLPNKPSPAHRHSNDGVFGHGPWPCQNPLAAHYQSLVVKKIERYIGAHKKEGALFTCSCGYIYRQMRLLDGPITSPRVVEPGPLMKVHVETAVRENWTLAQTARPLNANPEFVLRYAELNNIAHQWGDHPKNGKFKALGHVPSRKNDNRRRSTGRKIGYEDSEIRQIDEKLSNLVSAKKSEILARRPFERVSKQKVRREIPRVPAVSPDRLPKTISALAECAETVSEFRKRRLFTALEGFGDRPRPSIYRLARLAGCTEPASRPWVRCQIEIFDREKAKAKNES